jgi:pimeloyl-ACP methyl ester carboxylesterase
VSTFLLLHGARHGAWCWAQLAAQLEDRGHAAIAVDLPAGDASAGAVRYAEVAAQAVGGKRVTVVGHSLAGLVIPLLPDLVEVEELVFLCSPLPVPGRSLREQIADDPHMFVAGSLPRATTTPGATLELDDEYALRIYYHDCPPAQARWAIAQLRLQSTTVQGEPSPVREWPPRVASRYIMGSNDRIVDPAWVRRAVPERLGIRPLELPTGHSPFLARPSALADALLV